MAFSSNKIQKNPGYMPNQAPDFKYSILLCICTIKSLACEKMLMMSLQVICGLGPPPIKYSMISSISLTVVWEKPLFAW